jgi:hypothetical protein
MAAGHGGHILVADSTAVLLSGVDLLNLGSQRLRDVPIPITLFQLEAQGLPTGFPPLRTLDATSAMRAWPLSRKLLACSISEAARGYTKYRQVPQKHQD